VYSRPDVYLRKCSIPRKSKPQLVFTGFEEGQGRHLKKKKPLA